MISREIIRLIYGVLLFLAFAIWLLAISGVAEAQGVTRVTAGGLIINMQDPQKIEFHCREGELAGPEKTKTAWVLSCKKKSNGGTPPPVDPPPSGCPKPSMGLVDQRGNPLASPALAPPLFVNQQIYALPIGRWTTYKFNSNDYNGSLSQIGPNPRPGGQSDMTTQVIGLCPGVFDIKTHQRGCFASGGSNNLRFGTVSGTCKLQPNKTYYLYVFPGHPVNLRPKCGRKCGIVHFVRK